ncbi:MAG: amidohydrolase family protein [Oscillospiraceae bacterium]|nr:amidohydrolase family protein [Oscillospiraceae bacterium]
MDLTKQVKKIDCHVHPQFAGGPERMRGGTWPTPEQVREAYDTLNIESGVLMSCLAPEHMHDPISSRDAQAMHEAYPETFPWWFCALDPRMAWNDPARVPDYSYYIDFYRELGARGAGELQAHMMLDDPRMLGLLMHCEKKNFPVTIHFGKPGVGQGLLDDLGLVRLEKVLQQFPKLTLLAHAASFWSEISADVAEETRHTYSTGPIAQEGRIAVLLRKYPNLICDISANSGYRALSRDPDYTWRFFDEFFEQIVFATDISSRQTIEKTAVQLSSLLDDGYRAGNISEKAYRCICRENALRILQA